VFIRTLRVESVRRVGKIAPPPERVTGAGASDPRWSRGRFLPTLLLERNAGDRKLANETDASTGFLLARAQRMMYDYCHNSSGRERDDNGAARAQGEAVRLRYAGGSPRTTPGSGHGLARRADLSDQRVCPSASRTSMISCGTWSRRSTCRSSVPR
jgi:hypothetical protein